MLEDGPHLADQVRTANNIIYKKCVCHESRSTMGLVAHMFVHERYSADDFYISTIGVTLMIDYDTTTMAVDNRLRRYREANLCSDMIGLSL